MCSRVHRAVKTMIFSFQKGTTLICISNLRTTTLVFIVSSVLLWLLLHLFLVFCICHTHLNSNSTKLNVNTHIELSFSVLPLIAKPLSKLCGIIDLLLHVLPDFFPSVTYPLQPFSWYFPLWKRQKFTYFYIIRQYNNYSLYSWSLFILQIVENQISEYLNINSYHEIFQSGFHQCHSTEAALMKGVKLYLVYWYC